MHFHTDKFSSSRHRVIRQKLVDILMRMKMRLFFLDYHRYSRLRRPHHPSPRCRIKIIVRSFRSHHQIINTVSSSQHTADRSVMATLYFRSFSSGDYINIKWFEKKKTCKLSITIINIIELYDLQN